MMNNMLKIIFKNLSICLKIMKIYFKGPSEVINLSDIFPLGIEDIIKSDQYEKRFRLCKSNAEYNQEVVDYYKYHRGSFYLDQRSRDGHFPV
jgi:hypothetical protein